MQLAKLADQGYSKSKYKTDSQRSEKGTLSGHVRSCNDSDGAGPMQVEVATDPFAKRPIPTSHQRHRLFQLVSGHHYSRLKDALC